MTLDDRDLALLADLIAERLRGDAVPAPALVGVREVAAYLSVEPSWVYEHASQLGARKLGTGPKARLRFSLAEVDAKVTVCESGKESITADPPSLQGSRARRRRRTGTRIDLLPIRGLHGPDSGFPRAAA